MKNLLDAYYDCLNLVSKAGINDVGNVETISINRRATSRWGNCRKTIRNGKVVYSIQISHMLLDDGIPKESLYNTIIHEIIHTCPNCMNHGQEWKKRAEAMKKVGYNIQRGESAEEKGVSKEIERKYIKPKYLLKCKGCGLEIGKQRMCEAVRFPQWYRCSKCGGDLERIK